MSIPQNRTLSLNFISFIGHLSVSLFFWLLTAPSIYAHEIKPAIVDLNYSGMTAQAALTVEMIVNLESLMAEIGPAHTDTDESENSVRYGQLRALESDALRTAFAEFEPRFLAGVSITDKNNEPLTLHIRSITIPSVGDTELSRDTTISLGAMLADEVDVLRWQWNEMFGEVIVRANSDTQDMDYAALLSPGQTSDFMEFTNNSKQSVFSVITNYLVVGFEHILPKGLDHILFVLSLFLLSPKWRPLLLQITTFTVAHSITLALGASKIVNISPNIVEPMIALSIVFICLENLFVTSLNKWRLVMVFLFGLLHGLGFASVLEEVGLDSTNFLIALLGFNVGVELGQLSIIALCWLLVGYWIGKKPWYPSYFSKPASMLIGFVGVYWFVQRTL